MTRLYLDTSVLGGCFDKEFAPWLNGLIDDIRRGFFQAVLSDLTAAEVVEAPSNVRELHAELLGRGAELLATTEETLTLLTAYERHGILGKRFRNDMLHIALATVAEADLLTSWNFRHIVRYDRIRLFTAVNIEQGYRALPIHSPREVTTYGREDDQSGRARSGDS